MTAIQRHQKAIERYKTQANEFIAFVKEKYNIELSYSDESYADEECCSLELNFGGLYITSEQLMYGKFGVGYDSWDMGDRWQPPTCDMEEYSTNRTFEGALGDILSLTIQAEYTSYSMTKFMEQELKYENERKRKEEAQEENPATTGGEDSYPFKDEY